MAEELGLRARKKQRTRRELVRVATDLFTAKGYDNVSVAEIAEAAEVSKMTVFNYFGTKEDLIMSAPERHVDEPAHAVRDREPGHTPVDAIRRYFLEGLERNDPVTGLSWNQVVRDVQKLIREVPVLRLRYGAYAAQAQRRLADHLASEPGCDALTAEVVAAQIEGVRNALIRRNMLRVAKTRRTASSQAEAVAEAEAGFAMLERGLGDVLRR